MCIDHHLPGWSYARLKNTLRVFFRNRTSRMCSLRPIYNLYKHISTPTAHLSTGISLWKTHLAPPLHPQRSAHRAPTAPPKKMLQGKKPSYGSPITLPGHTNTRFRDLRFKNQRPLVELGMVEGLEIPQN